MWVIIQPTQYPFPRFNILPLSPFIFFVPFILLFPSLPSSSWLFPWENFGIHTEERKEQMGTAQDGHVGDKEMHRWTHSRGDRRQRQGPQSCSCPLSSLLLNQLSSLLWCPSQGSLPRAKGHSAVARRLGRMMGHGELTNTTASSSGSLDRGYS